MIDETKIRIISDTTTFYPLDNEDSQHRNDNLSLRATIIYLKNQLNEDFRFFRSGDIFVVLQQWREMLFLIETTQNISKDLLRIQLQIIKEILVFLFGQRFENVMRRNISLTKRAIFAKYVDQYLLMCRQDYLSLVCALQFDIGNEYVNTAFQEIAAELYKIPDNICMQILLFNNNKIVSSFVPEEVDEFEPDVQYLLQIYEGVEFSPSTEPFDLSLINLDFLQQEPSPITHKSAFLKLNGAPTRVTLSSTRLYPNSPLTLIFVSINSKMPDEQKTAVTFQICEIAKKLKETVATTAGPTELEVPEGLIHSVVIDRTNGGVVELPPDVSLALLRRYTGAEEDAAKETLRQIQTRLASYAMTALLRGSTVMMVGEDDFQYCYELRCVGPDGELLRPTGVYTAPSFDSDVGVSYASAAAALFPGRREPVHVFELLSIFVGTTHVKEVVSGNNEVFAQAMLALPH